MATIAEKPWNSPTTGGTEVNAWLIIGSDDSVTIRVAQSEMGEGVFTSMPMVVAEELECDWTKVRAEYASVNRSVRENRVYQRMATNGSGAVRMLTRVFAAGWRQHARALTAAAAQQWGVPARECRAENGRVIPCRVGGARSERWGWSLRLPHRSSLTPSRPSRLPTGLSSWANP